MQVLINGPFNSKTVEKETERALESQKRREVVLATHEDHGFRAKRREDTINIVTVQDIVTGGTTNSDTAVERAGAVTVSWATWTIGLGAAIELGSGRDRVGGVLP